MCKNYFSKALKSYFLKNNFWAVPVGRLVDRVDLA